MSFFSLLGQRCPRCKKGPLFQRLFKMNQTCSVCELPFEPEPGYYTGAMYFSYLIGTFILIPIWLYLMYSEWPFLTALFSVLGLNILMAPFLFRYSRVVWLHMDYGFDRKDVVK
ncbi:MAG TPA: DUF983 domain-containing protein [Calditrichia bacterium]|nr:DUF983 domain-containing protein [Calditrichia bacterium]